jgi:hypothetical protein
MRAWLYPSLIVALAAPGIAGAQQLGGQSLHPPDSAHVTLFPHSLVAPAPNTSRFQLLARQIDSASAVGEEIQSETAARQEAAQTSARLLLLTEVAHGFDRRPSFGRDWMSAVTAAGLTQLDRVSLFAPPDESSPTIWQTLRTDGQFAGLATLTGGASWLLSNLTRYTPRFGTLRPHVVTHTH